VNNNIISSYLNVEAYCSDGVIEVCCVKFKFQGKEIYILTVYRSPSGNFANFIGNLEKIVCSFFNYKNDLIICGDMNFNYLEQSSRVRQLNALLKTYSLVNVVKFPTRICDQSSTSIDNVFIDISRSKNFTISLVSNGLSDHEVQVLTLVSPLPQIIEYQFYTYRKTNTLTVTDFLNQLSYEN
jgi:hypothetical protein